MRTKLQLLLLLWSSFFPLTAQIELHLGKGCQYDDGTEDQEIYGYAPSNAAQQAVNRISSAMRTTNNFILKGANVRNALASRQGTSLYILYKPSLLDDIDRDARTKWTVYGVLAHEIGHHYNGDNFDETDNSRRKKMELAADIYAGYALQKLGASLEDAQEAVRTVVLNSDETARYPKKFARMEAVATGWKQAQEGRGLNIDYVPKDREKEAQEWYDKGVAVGDNYKKIEYFSKAIELKSDYVDAWWYRGWANNELGKYADAISDYDQGIRLKPDASGIWNNRGNSKNNLGRYSEAISDLNQAIRLAPDDADPWNNRGISKNGLGKYTEAISDYDQAIRLKPDYTKAWNNRGFTKYNLGKYAEAISDFDQAIKLDSKFARPYTNKGCALVKLGDKSRLGEAIDLINKGLNLDPTLTYANDCKKEALKKLSE